ncbi:MAG: aromatic acid exporter family protein [Gammaproteobacteria bacterium]
MVSGSELFSRLPGALSLALRAALASSLAVAVAQLFALRYPIYALIAAVIVTDPSPAATRRLAAHRVVGTALGAVCGALLSTYFGHALWALGLGVLVMVTLALLGGYTEAGKLAGYVAGLVVLDHSAEAWVYAFARFVETAVGIAAALLVGVVFAFVGARGRLPRKP